jgi:GntR family transcriptional repressor for pyruvate dehydrogenase complex
MFQPIKNEKIYRMVISQVRKLIEDGRLSPGDRLPPERELAEMLDVSRPSVRQAISALEALGVVEIRHGDGTFVAMEGGVNFVESFSKLLINEQLSPVEILETRRMVECYAARLCAERASDGQIGDLFNLLEKNRPAPGKKTDYEVMNRDFHKTIAEGTGNRGIMALMDDVIRMMSSNMWPRIKEISARRLAKRKRHIEQHEEIYAAIAARDADLAARKMFEHLETIENDLN